MKRHGKKGCPFTALLRAASACLLIAMISTSAAAAEEQGGKGKGYVELSGGYKTGDFGTGTRSNLYYLGPTLGYVSPSWDIGVTVPYLILSQGTANRGAITGVANSMANGVGDVILRTGRVLVPEGGVGFSLDGALALKFPTARASDGLGTGKADYGAFAGIHQRIGRIRVSLLGGYIKVGDPTGLDYRDTPLYGVGISGIFGRTNLAASFEGRQSIIPGTLNPQEVNLSLFHVLRRNLALKAGTFFGLNNGGPDFGLNAGFVRFF